MTPDAAHREYPGFDLVRVIAALAVVFSHSFLLAETNEDSEPFQMLTGEILGVYGVYIFFILSGFLVSDSALRSRGLWKFMEKRARRILPAFVVANLVVVLAVAPLFAPGGGIDYLSDPDTWSTLFNVLTLQEYRLWYETVSFYDGSNAAGIWLSHSVNGVLWTIRLEIVCYGVVGVLLATGLLRANITVLLVAVGTIYAFQYQLQPVGWGGFGLLFPSFAAGMAMRLHIGDHIPSGRIACLSSLGLGVAMFFVPSWDRLAPALFPLFASYPLLWFGVNGRNINTVLIGNADPSYGIYIWGWPVQQLLLAGLIQLGVTGISGPVFALLAMPAAYLAGVASWHLVEQPFLRRQRPKLAAG